MDFRLTRRAEADIKSIIRYTDLNFGPAQTKEYLGGLFNSFDLLTDNPELGREWSRGRRRLSIVCITFITGSPRRVF